MRNKQFNIVMPDELIKKLKLKAEKQYTTVSEIIRQLIIKCLQDDKDED